MLRERDRRGEVARFKPWVYRVCRNLCLNRLRGRERATRAMDRMAREPAPDRDGPESALERAEVTEALRRAVSRLPEHLGEVYAMRAADMSYESLAEVLEIPVGTVKSRVNAMLERPRKEMV